MKVAMVMGVKVMRELATWLFRPPQSFVFWRLCHDPHSHTCPHVARTYGNGKQSLTHGDALLETMLQPTASLWAHRHLFHHPIFKTGTRKSL